MSGERTLGDILGEALSVTTPAPMHGDFVTAIIAAALPPPPDPPITRAARGEREALTELARGAYAAGLNAKGPARLALLGQAAAFGRLAMVHGDPIDAHATVSILGEIAASCRSLGDAVAGDQYEGQGVLLAEMLAEDGDDTMADLIAANASLVTAGAFREARRLHDLSPPISARRASTTNPTFTDAKAMP